MNIALHPAARRRIMARMPDFRPHPVHLAPLCGEDATAVIATLSGENFLDRLFNDLKAPDWRARLAAHRSRRRGSDGRLELGLPVHRLFQVALYEAHCDVPGKPRLDPRKLQGMGLVLRRRRADGGRDTWRQNGQDILGWRGVPDQDADPETQGAAGIESVLPLHPAPPEVSAALGRTVLFAILPVVSTETSTLPPPAIDYAALPAADRAEMVRHFSEYLKERPKLAMPRAGQLLDAGWNILDDGIDASTEGAQLGSLGTFLQQAMVELDLLGDGTASRRLLGLLSGIRLPLERSQSGIDTSWTDAASFVRAAIGIFVERQGNAGSLRMPLEWPKIDATLGGQLTTAALDCLGERHGKLAGGEAKFGDDHALYRVRAFVRVPCTAGCPPRLFWSMESEPFRILPWWDGEGPGATVQLPDFDQLKKVKPSVRFAMPASLANLLSGSKKKLMDGEGSTGGGGVDWLCSFSIPVITLCAFIVLNIFLSLFDIFLRWMMFLKVCIPIPKRR